MRLKVLLIADVLGVFLVAARAFVAVEAFAIVVRLVKLDRVRRRSPDVMPHVFRAAQLGLEVAKHRVRRVATEAGPVARYLFVLEVNGRDEAPVAHPKAAAVGLHDVAGKTEFGALGLLEVVPEAPCDNDRW